jgi:hypothetical protein
MVNAVNEVYMNRKQTVGVRLPVPWVEKLKAMSEETGFSQSDLLLEAIACYLGKDGLIGDRLGRLERDVSELKRKLAGLSQ